MSNDIKALPPKRKWETPEIYLLDKGYDVNGGSRHGHNEANYTQSYRTIPGGGALRVLKGPGHHATVNSNVHWHDYRTS
jgi:hypothetical protein